MRSRWKTKSQKWVACTHVSKLLRKMLFKTVQSITVVVIWRFIFFSLFVGTFVWASDDGDAVFQQMRYLFGCLLQRRRVRPFIIIWNGWDRCRCHHQHCVVYIAKHYDCCCLLHQRLFLNVRKLLKCCWKSNSVAVCGGQQFPTNVNLHMEKGTCIEHKTNKYE